MREQVKQKIINDLVVTPLVIGPTMIGLTALMFGWAVASSTLAFLGFGAVLAGLGVFSTKLIFGLDSITKNAYETVIKEKEDKRNNELDDLEKKLCKNDRDPIPEACLRQLRTIYRDLKKKAEGNPLGMEVIANYEKTFDVCVKKLELTDQLLQDARGLTGDFKKEKLKKRANLVKEIESTTQKIVDSVNGFQVSVDKVDDQELSAVQTELSAILEVAKRTGERQAGLGTEVKSYDPKEFE